MGMINEFDTIAAIATAVSNAGIGIIRKKPEIKWNKSRKSLKDLVPTQREIMENAWTYLKTGGTMLYSTCTLNKEENEEISEEISK